MLPALLTAVLFAASGICGRRAAVAFGALRANAWRLALASMLLGWWVWSRTPVDFSTRSVHRLLVSGVVGFGLGDACLFLAYPRIGARLTILVNLCSAPVFGAVLDWVLLGAGFTCAQLLMSGVILSGVMLALLAWRRGEGVDLGRTTSLKYSGLAFALLAGFGQGCGAALSRHAHAAALEDGTVINGVAQAFVRTLPGLAFALAAWSLGALFWKPAGRKPDANPVWGWLVGAAMFGPVLGVSCFQWALSLESSAVVLSITAITPVLIMPMAFYIDKDRPSGLAVLGACIAVAGVVGMMRVVAA